MEPYHAGTAYKIGDNVRDVMDAGDKYIWDKEKRLERERELFPGILKLAKKNAEESLKSTRGVYKLNDNVSHLGEKINDFYSFKKNMLSDMASISIENCVSTARAYLQAAKIDNATFFLENIENGLMADNEYTRKCASVETTFFDWGNGDIDGFLNYISSLDVIDMVTSENIAVTDSVLLGDEILLEAMGIYLLSEAENAIRNENLYKALDLIHDAYSAFEGSDARYMFREGEKSVLEDTESDLFKKAKSELAKKAAYSRHAEHREFRKDVLDWYSKNGHNYSSIERAADAAIKLVPVRQRTARDWIAKWRKQQSASTT